MVSILVSGVASEPGCSPEQTPSQELRGNSTLPGLLMISEDQELQELAQALSDQEGWPLTVAHRLEEACQHAASRTFGAALLLSNRLSQDSHTAVAALRQGDSELPILLLARTEGPSDPEEVRLALRNALAIGHWRWKAKVARDHVISSEMRFRAVVESAVDAIILAAADGTIVSWNKAAETLFQYSEAEVRGQPLSMIMPTRYRDAHEKGLARLHATGQSRLLGKPVELHGLKKDGSEFPLELSVAAWKTAEHTFFSGIVRDITERKRVENALRASEERLEVAVRGSSDGLWDLQPSSSEPWYSPRAPVWFSPRFTEMLGFAEGELGHTLESWTSRLHHQDWSRLLDALRAHIERKEPLDLECRLRTKPGEYRWFRVRGRAIWDANDALVRVAGSLQCVTDRKQAEAALRQAEERYRSIFENAVEGIFQETPDGRLLIANPAFARMLGYDSPDVLLNMVTDVGATLYVHPEQHQELVAALEARQVIEGFEAQLRREDGTPIWVSMNARAVHPPDSAWRHFEVTAEDITVRKREASRLAKINECFLRFGKDADQNINRLTALCGELLGGDWAVYSRLQDARLFTIGRWQIPADLSPVSDPQGHICAEVMNLGGEKAWVLRNLPGTKFADTDPVVRAYGLQTYIGQAVRRGSSYVGTLCVMYRRDYQPTPSDERLIGIVGSAIGVEEERKAAEHALRQAFQQTDVILESLPNAVLVVQEDLTIVKANALAFQYFGAGLDTLAGVSLASLFPKEEAARCRLIFSASPYSAELGYWQQDREFHLNNRIFRYRCFPVDIRGRQRPQAGLVVWDMTDERQLQDQLVQSEKLASLGTMVSGMAHEINNPAQAILGLSEIIRDEDASDRMREYAADIAGYAQHIAAVVRDFACYARASSREGETAVDLNELLVDAVKMVRRGPHFGHVEVVTELQPLQALMARRSEIEQIFVNIISNAVQAMNGQGRLTLSTASKRDTMVVSISDTGCGIPRSVLAKIFDPFFTTKDPGKGTGLGLSIVHKIVEKYGGAVKVQSQEGRGTTFRIEFPVTPSHKEDHHGRHTV